MRDGRSLQGFEQLGQDVRYAARGLLRAPGFSLTAIVSLALGLGAGLAIFTVADDLLLRPLPYPAPSQLVMLWETKRTDANQGLGIISPGNYFDWKTQAADVFESMGGFRENRAVLSADGRVEELQRQLVTADILPMLGVRPVLGRVFSTAEDGPDARGPLVISHRLWRQWFGGDPSIIGRTVQINATPRTIIGVLPAGFYFRDREFDLWEPMGLNPTQDYRHTEGRWMLCLARLKPGIAMTQAQARMTAIAARLEVAHPDFNHQWTVSIQSLRDSMVGEIKTPLVILLAAVALLLAVACANVAGLLLARGDARRRELAVRASLGASRWRVVRLLLTESALLGLVSALLALLLARAIIVALLAIAPATLLRGAEVQVDWRIVAFGMALSSMTVLLFGLAPALISTGRHLVRPLRDDSRTTAASIGGRGAGGVRGWLVSAEVALTVVLLIGATLLFRTLVGLHAVDPGLDPAHVVTMRVSLPHARYQQDAARTRFFTRALADIERLPGVAAAGAVSDLPFVQATAGVFVNVEGEPPAPPGTGKMAVLRTVMPGYFKAMGIPLRGGREFTDADNANPNTPVRFVVNESFVRVFLGNRSPFTTRVQSLMEAENPFGHIIGVTGDVKEGALDRPPEPTIYYVHGRLAFDSLVLVVRTTGVESLDLVAPIRRIIARLDPAQPIADVQTMESIVGDTVARQRFSAVLLSAFSIVSLTLACVGVYGVLAYAVSRRTREIGVRIALGARPGGIVWLIVGAGARMVFAGFAVGLAAAGMLSRLMASMLFGIGPRDPSTFALVPIALVSIALIAAALPARRAARLDPSVALRGD